MAQLIRILVYEGPENWIKESMTNREIKGEVLFVGQGNVRIREAILGDLYQILQGKEAIDE